MFPIISFSNEVRLIFSTDDFNDFFFKKRGISFWEIFDIVHLITFAPNSCGKFTEICVNPRSTTEVKCQGLQIISPGVTLCRSNYFEVMTVFNIAFSNSALGSTKYFYFDAFLTIPILFSVYCSHSEFLWLLQFVLGLCCDSLPGWDSLSALSPAA